MSGLHGRVLKNGVSSGCRGYEGYMGITCDYGGPCAGVRQGPFSETSMPSPHDTSLNASFANKNSSHHSPST